MPLINIPSHIPSAGIVHTSPEECFQSSRRLWQGCPTIECTPKGRLLAGWYSGGMREPDMMNYNLLVRSDDDGNTWSEPILVIESDASQGIRCIDIQLWQDPTGKFWLFWTQTIGWNTLIPEHRETWAMTTSDPDAEQISWSEPFYVTDGFLRCKPTVLHDGRYLLCAYDSNSSYYQYSESSDAGMNWEVHRAGRKLPTLFDESMILEQCDGTLRLFARTNNTGFIAESISHDGGKSWSDGENTSLTAPGSRFYIARLASGNLLRINNNCASARKNLTAFLSTDDGATWPYSILLDDRETTSYPDAAQGKDGFIYIVHDWNRTTDKTIYLSRLTEADIMAGRPTTNRSCVRQMLNQPPRHPVCPR